MAGFKQLGYKISRDVDVVTKPRPDDVLVTWQRYSSRHDTALRFEKVGATVIIAENGYIGHHDNDHGKPIAVNGKQLYALSLNMHGGAGRWWVGEPGRWRELGIELKPWRETGHHILLIAQRGIGVPPVASPADWLDRTERRLRKIATRPIKVRPHPGNYPPRIALAKDLSNAWCAVTWASAAGIRAICSGVPVFSDFDQWIGASCARQNFDEIESPLCDDEIREAMMDRLAWAQFTMDEIATGLPMGRLIALHQEEHCYA
jgi:hypothetical protein